jgi:cell shape-determining protein MreD
LAQRYVPALTILGGSKVLLVHLVFLCAAVTVGMPTTLLLAFISGFLWDAQCALGPHGGNPDIYDNQVENLHFGYSILLFGLIGLLMQGFQPWFKKGRWQLSALLSGVAIFVYLISEYLVINFVRGEFVLTTATIKQIALTSCVSMLLSPLVFGLLFWFANICNHTIKPEAEKRFRHNQ